MNFPAPHVHIHYCLCGQCEGEIEIPGRHSLDCARWLCDWCEAECEPGCHNEPPEDTP